MAGKEDNELYTYVKTCADCGSKRILVTDSREADNGSIRRHRRCSECGYEFTTVEIEECISDLGGLLHDIDKLKKEKAALEERIYMIKAKVRDM